MSLSVGASQSPLLLVQRLTLPFSTHRRCQANRLMLVGDVSVWRVCNVVGVGDAWRVWSRARRESTPSGRLRGRRDGSETKK